MVTTLVLLALVCAGACDAEGTPTAAAAPAQASAIFAGGCFWCMESPFDAIDGVQSTTAGYTGGSVRNPSYAQVSSGSTGHAEAVRVTYDPERVSYDELLDVFWRNIDPTDPNGQFCDRGSQYRSAIFVANDDQRRAAIESRRRVARKLGAEVATEVADAQPFYAAEPEHQDYSEKNPVRYRIYRFGCGRDARLHELWGDDAGH